MPSNRFVLSLLLAACAIATRAEDKDSTLRTRLATAAADSSLDTPGLAPWHLKLEVQLFDDKGKPSEQGMVERWWISPADVQTIYSFPGYSATEVLSATNTLRTKGVGLPPDAVTTLLHQVTHPLPQIEDVDRAIPEFRKQTFGKVPLDCIMLDQPMLVRSSPPVVPPLGLFPTFCFDPDRDNLRLSFDFGSELVVRNATGNFQGRKVATSITINENMVSAAEGHVTTLESRANLNMPPVDEASLEVLPAKVPLVSSALMKGMRLSAPDPIYPQSAKNRRVSGSVLLRGIIGRNGRVRSLRFISVPDPDLAVAAISAVRQWVYKPYLLNGQPTEVDTTITVNFELR